MGCSSFRAAQANPTAQDTVALREGDDILGREVVKGRVSLNAYCDWSEPGIYWTGTPRQILEKEVRKADPIWQDFVIPDCKVSKWALEVVHMTLSHPPQAKMVSIDSFDDRATTFWAKGYGEESIDPSHFATQIGAQAELARSAGAGTAKFSYVVPIIKKELRSQRHKDAAKIKKPYVFEVILGAKVFGTVRVSADEAGAKAGQAAEEHGAGAEARRNFDLKLSKKGTKAFSMDLSTMGGPDVQNKVGWDMEQLVKYLHEKWAPSVYADPNRWRVISVHVEEPPKRDFEKKMEQPHIAVFGGTGAGKSMFLTALCGGEDLFPAGHSAHSYTSVTTSHVVQPVGVRKLFRLTDTPGLLDTEGRDESLSAPMLKELAKHVCLHTLCFVLKGTEHRFDGALQQVAKKLHELFGEKIWAHVALIFTHWDFREDEDEERKQQEVKAGKFDKALKEKIQGIRNVQRVQCFFVDSQALWNGDRFMDSLLQQTHDEMSQLTEESKTWRQWKRQTERSRLEVRRLLNISDSREPCWTGSLAPPNFAVGERWNWPAEVHVGKKSPDLCVEVPPCDRAETFCLEIEGSGGRRLEQFPSQLEFDEDTGTLTWDIAGIPSEEWNELTFVIKPGIYDRQSVAHFSEFGLRRRLKDTKLV